MRLQFKGTYTVDEFQALFERFLENLRDNDIQSLARVNLYFQPCFSGGELSLYDSDGAPIEHMIVDDSPKKTFVPSTPELITFAKKRLVPKGDS